MSTTPNYSINSTRAINASMSLTYRLTITYAQTLMYKDGQYILLLIKQQNAKKQSKYLSIGYSHSKTNQGITPRSEPPRKKES